jgi:probable HAF family extracellular repeat protein
MRHQLLSASCLIAGVLVAHAGAVPAVSRYVIVDLGTLGGSQTEPAALNEHGEVTGWSRTSANAQHAFLFSNGRMRDLGTLGGDSSRGTAINDAGEVVGTAATRTNSHAFLYGAGRMHDLGTIAGDYSEASAINAAGQVTGVSSTADGRIRGFLYSEGSMIDLGSLGGLAPLPWQQRDSEGRAINAWGQITGYAYTALGRPHAFVYTPGAVEPMKDIPPMPTPYYSESQGIAINDLGHVMLHENVDFYISTYLFIDDTHRHNIGILPYGHDVRGLALNNSDQIAGTQTDERPPSGLGTHGFVYSDGVLTELTAYPGGGATALNNAGDVVGWQIRWPVDGTYPFLFTRGMAFDLNALVPPGSGWTLSEALRINDKGQIIGVGQTQGQVRAFLLNPVDRIASRNDQCKSGGWPELMRANGSSFTNQGDCVSYLNTGR